MGCLGSAIALDSEGIEIARRPNSVHNKPTNKTIGSDTMSLATSIKPISYLKSNAADIVKDFAINPETLIITQNGEAKMVVMDIHEYERQQETFALLKLIALGRRELEQGHYQEADAFFAEMDAEE
jgi:prevent-host-death family protein